MRTFGNLGNLLAATAIFAISALPLRSQTIADNIDFLVDNAPDGSVTIVGTGNLPVSSWSGQGTLVFDQIGLVYANPAGFDPFDSTGTSVNGTKAVATGAFKNFVGWYTKNTQNLAQPGHIVYDDFGNVISATSNNNFSEAEQLSVISSNFNFSPNSPVGGYLKLDQKFKWYDIGFRFSGNVYLNDQLIGRWQHVPEFVPTPVPELGWTGALSALGLLGFAGWRKKN